MAALFCSPVCRATTWRRLGIGVSCRTFCKWPKPSCPQALPPLQPAGHTTKETSVSPGTAKPYLAEQLPRHSYISKGAFVHDSLTRLHTTVVFQQDNGSYSEPSTGANMLTCCTGNHASPMGYKHQGMCRTTNHLYRSEASRLICSVT